MTGLNQLGGTPIERIQPEAIPQDNPVAQIGKSYLAALAACKAPFVPTLEEVMTGLDGDLPHFCLVMLPVASEPLIDFFVMQGGRLLPGTSAHAQIGERYSERIMPAFLSDRLLEFTSCIALKQPSFSRGLSPRRSNIAMHVYRAVLPVWSASKGMHAILLSAAPVFASMKSDLASVA